VAIYGAINFGAINLLLQKMEQFYGAIIWYHLMAPFYGMCVPGIIPPQCKHPQFITQFTRIISSECPLCHYTPRCG